MRFILAALAISAMFLVGSADVSAQSGPPPVGGNYAVIPSVGGGQAVGLLGLNPDVPGGNMGSAQYLNFDGTQTNGDWSWNSTSQLLRVTFSTGHRVYVRDGNGHWLEIAGTGTMPYQTPSYLVP